jgi:hypothetical protein
MTELLVKAFEEASKLKPQEQDELAKWLLEEIEFERKWSDSFEKSQSILERLADEAIREYQLGRTEELNIDNI